MNVIPFIFTILTYLLDFYISTLGRYSRFRPCIAYYIPLLTTTIGILTSLFTKILSQLLISGNKLDDKKTIYTENFVYSSIFTIITLLEIMSLYVLINFLAYLSIIGYIRNIYYKPIAVFVYYIIFYPLFSRFSIYYDLIKLNLTHTKYVFKKYVNFNIEYISNIYEWPSEIYKGYNDIKNYARAYFKPTVEIEPEETYPN
jgi:hypothetical protein